MTETAQNVADALPLSLPELRIMANEPYSDADVAELSAHGDAVFYTRKLLFTARMTGESTDGELAPTDIAALYTVDMANASAFYTLKSGRMPQNASECVVSVARGAFYDIGDTLVLWSGEEPLYRLTVVGLASDADSMLCAFSDEDTKNTIPVVHIYRLNGGESIQTDAVLYMAAIVHTEDTEASAEAISLYAKAKYESQVTEKVPDSAALEAAQGAVNEAQIKRLRIENQIASLDVAAAEAEEAYLLASEALEAERQEFISSMQRHEEVRANQTHLITRKEAAEEAFAKKQAELDTLFAQIEDIYAERDALRLSLAEAEEVAAAAESALSSLKAGETAEGEVLSAFTWSISMPRNEKTGDSAYLGLLSSGKEASVGFLLVGILCVLLTVACVLFWRHMFGVSMEFGAGNARTNILLLSVYSVLTAGLGAAIGGFVLAKWKFAHAFSTFDMTLAAPASVFPAVIAVALVLAALFVLLNVFSERLLTLVYAVLPAPSASDDDE